MKRLLHNQHTIAVFIWIILFGVYLLYPGKVDPFSMVGFYLSLFFCLLLTVGSIFSFGFKNELQKSFNIPSQKKLNQLNKIFFALSVLGLFLHLWDKIGIRGYNYFSCIDVREVWLADGALRKTGGVSSWQSALGHILVYFSVFPVIFSDLREKLGKILFSLSCIVFVIYCWTIVSRSSLLAFSMLSIASYHQFYSIGYINRKEFLRKFITLFTLLLFFVVLTFSKKIACASLSSTAEFVNGSMKEHKLSFDIIEGDASKPTPYHEVDKLLSPVFEPIKYAVELPIDWFNGDNKAAYVSNSIPLYAGNGINNFTQIANKSIDHDYKFIFNPFINIGNKIAGHVVITQTELRRTFTQGFINLPGAVHLTFGRWGIVLFPLILGLLIRFFYLYSSRNLLFIPFASFLQCFAILAPLTNLTSNMSTPFLFFATGVLILLSFYFKFSSKRNSDVIQKD